jgi:hypothetical protein
LVFGAYFALFGRFLAKRQREKSKKIIFLNNAKLAEKDPTLRRNSMRFEKKLFFLIFGAHFAVWKKRRLFQGDFRVFLGRRRRRRKRRMKGKEEGGERERGRRKEEEEEEE